MTIIMLSGQLKEVLFVILRNRRHLHRKKDILSAPNQSYYHTMKLLLATKSLINSKNLDDNANNDGRNRNRNRRTNLELSSSSSLSLSLSLLLYFHRNIQRFLIIISLSSQRRHQHHRSNSTPSIRSSSFLLRRSLLLLVFLQLWLMTFISSYQVRRSSSRIPIPSLSSSSSSSASIRSRQQQQERRRHYSSATSIILSTHSSIFSSSSSSSELAAASSIDSNDNIDDHSSDVVISDDETLVVVKNDDKWRSNLPRDMYASPKLWESHTEFLSFMKQFDIIDDENENDNENNNNNNNDHLWEQVKLEALSSLSTEPEAGPQLYQSILSQGSLVEAIVSTIARTL
jgi:predicted nucleic acid binding AN1-type Zn finger protein